MGAVVGVVALSTPSVAFAVVGGAVQFVVSSSSVPVVVAFRSTT